jgi:glycosyltransferase involved in cell wall biosynthesis
MSEGMKILLWHGYLLSGSGSNVYTLNVANAWRRQGHDVLVMCQQKSADEFSGVDAHGDFTPDNSSYSLGGTGIAEATGTISVVRPDIGGLLPVYVYDDYEGFTVKRYTDLDDAELDRYVALNVAAMMTALQQFEPDAVITGHEVMGPSIARVACERTGNRYAAKLHGSALEYAVKVQDRYLRHATEGLGGALHVVGGSRYMVEEAASIIPGWRDRAVVINPGVDVELFTPRADRTPGATVAFVGKLIAEKGAHNFVAALGAINEPVQEAVIVGYGGDEVAIADLVGALRAGDRLGALAVAGRLRLADPLTAWLERADDHVLARFSSLPIRFTGRLEHGPLSEVLPTFDVLVVPSIVHEAFGMVAAEAAACAVLPLVPNHSGIGEAGEALEERLGIPGLLTFDKDRPIEGIAAGIDRLLALDAGTRVGMGAAACEVARERWAWERVAERLLETAV